MSDPTLEAAAAAIRAGAVVPAGELAKLLEDIAGWERDIHIGYIQAAIDARLLAQEVLVGLVANRLDSTGK